MTPEFSEKFEVTLLDWAQAQDLSAVYLFNSPPFYKLHAAQASDDYFYYVLSNKKNKKPLAAFWCGRSDGRNFRSPSRGSFGGVSVLGPLSFVALEGFLDFIESHLKGSALEMVLPPFSYSQPETSMLVNVLLRKGYTISNHEINYSMAVDSGCDFKSLVDAKNRNKINKCIREGFELVRLTTEEEFKTAYSVIEENRAKKGIPVTMPWDGLSEMLEKIPGSVHFFGCYNQGVMIASSICMRISSKIFYVFYWGEVAGMESYSPVSYLASDIYDYCSSNGFECLDAGTASVWGVPNVGLASYKKKLGFGESLKLTLSKGIS